MPILLQEICGPILGKYISLTDTCRNVEIGTEVVQFPEKEFINGIFVAVRLYIKKVNLPEALYPLELPGRTAVEVLHPPVGSCNHNMHTANFEQVAL